MVAFNNPHLCIAHYISPSTPHFLFLASSFPVRQKHIDCAQFPIFLYMTVIDSL